jgi:hypothetical protein
MRLGGTCLAAFSIALLALGGCQKADQSRLPPPEEMPATESAAAIAPEQVISGELTAVDPDAKTFSVMAGDVEYRFLFTDATDVLGTGGARGLTGREGTRVTVHYREELGSRMAVSIEID